MASVDRKWLPPMLIAAGGIASVLAYGRMSPTVHLRMDGLLPFQGQHALGPAPRWLALFAMPALALALWIAFRLAPTRAGQRIGRRMFHSAPEAVTTPAQFERFGKTYEAIVLAVVMLVMGVHAAVLAAALQAPGIASRIVPAAFGVSLVLMGNVIPRLRPNWVAGLRTKRLLADPQLWRRAHRLFGISLAMSGLVTIGAAVAAPAYGLLVALASVSVSLVVGFIASRRGGYSHIVPAALALTIAGASARAQQPSADRFIGNWQGSLQAGPMKLRLALTVTRDSTGGVSGVLTSIDQGNQKLPAQVTITGDTVVASIAGGQVTYTGVITAAGDSLHGTFRQAGATPLDMARVAALAEVVRPQNPKAPFPYSAEEVSFESAPGVRLAGTFITPAGNGPFPAVVFVTGSGPQDRDEALMGHRPFLVIADYLARHGIASLRYDDRGIAKSTGSFATATSMDFAADAEAAVRFLKTKPVVAPNKIGIIGHSEGGLIAPIVAARSRDVAFIVMMAGPGIPGDSILVLQQRLVLSTAGVPAAQIDRNEALNRALYKALRASKDSADAVARLKAAVAEFVATLPEAERAPISRAAEQAVGQLVSPWMRYFIVYDPAPTLRKVRVPVLALNGTLDLQVPYRANLPAIDAALKAAGNRDYKIVELPKLNHLFQSATNGGVAEYGTIEETVSPTALELIANWINERFGRK